WGLFAVTGTSGVSVSFPQAARLVRVAVVLGHRGVRDLTLARVPWLQALPGLDPGSLSMGQIAEPLRGLVPVVVQDRIDSLALYGRERIRIAIRPLRDLELTAMASIERR